MAGGKENKTQNVSYIRIRTYAIPWPHTHTPKAPSQKTVVRRTQHVGFARSVLRPETPRGHRTCVKATAGKRECPRKRNGQNKKDARILMNEVRLRTHNCRGRGKKEKPNRGKDKDRTQAKEGTGSMARERNAKTSESKYQELRASATQHPADKQTDKE